MSAIESSSTPVFTSMPLQSRLQKKAPDAAVSSTSSGKIDRAVVYVKEGFVYIYGRAGETLFFLKAKVSENYEFMFAKAQALECYCLLRDALEGSKVRLQDLALLLSKRFVDGKLYLKDKASQNLSTLSNLASRVPVPVFLKRNIMFLSDKGKSLIVEVRYGCTCIYGKLEEYAVCIKVKGINSYSQVREQAMKLFADIVRKMEPYTLQIEDVFVSLKGKVNGAVVTICQNKDRGVALLKNKAAKTCGDLQITIGNLPATQKLTDAVQATKVKAAEKPVTAGALGGAMLIGTGGGAAGGIAGSVAGMTAGLPFALFTFGLSIPVAAVVGGGLGATAGAAVGGATGAVGGSALGFGYSHRQEIQDGAKSTMAKAVSAKDKVVASAGAAKGKIADKAHESIATISTKLASGTGSSAN